MKSLLMGIPPAFPPGLSEISDGAGMTAASTVKPPGTDCVEPPVVTDTPAGPSGAPAAIFSETVTLVAVADVTGPGNPGPAAPATVIPSAVVPMVTVEDELQLVYWPVMVTDRAGRSEEHTSELQSLRQ